MTPITNSTSESCPDLNSKTESSNSSTLIFLTIFLTIINIIVIFGNLMVIAAAKTSRKLRNNVTVLFVISLAMSDLLLGAFVLPLSIVNQVLYKRWIFGKVICYTWLAMDVWLFTASILNLVVISFDRFLAIRLPTKYPDLITKRWARFLVVCVWSLAFIICFPTILQILQPSANFNADARPWRNIKFNKTQNNEPPDPINITDNCSENQYYICTIATSSPSYIVYSAMGSFYIPLFIMCYFYLQIYLIIRRHAKGIRRGHLKSNIRRDHTVTLRVHYGGLANGPNRASTKSSVSITQPAQTPAERPLPPVETENNSCEVSEREVLMPPNRLSPPKLNSPIHSVPAAGGASLGVGGGVQRCSIRLATSSDKRVSRFHRETKAARTLGIVCGAFTFCLLPFFSVYLSGAFCNDCVPGIVFDIAFWLGYCNSALNPAIYALFSREFRLAFKKLLRCRCRSVEQSFRSTTYVL